MFFCILSSRLWLLQVFTVLCLLFENSKFIENLILKDSSTSSSPPPSSSSSSLIQVISEESSQEPDSSLWSLPSLDSLCDLHPLLHSILFSHSSGFFFQFFSDRMWTEMAASLLQRADSRVSAVHSLFAFGDSLSSRGNGVFVLVLRANRIEWIQRNAGNAFNSRKAHAFVLFHHPRFAHRPAKRSRSPTRPIGTRWTKHRGSSQSNK